MCDSFNFISFCDTSSTSPSLVSSSSSTSELASLSSTTLSPLQLILDNILGKTMLTPSFSFPFIHSWTGLGATATTPTAPKISTISTSTPNSPNIIEMKRSERSVHTGKSSDPVSLSLSTASSSTSPQLMSYEKKYKRSRNNEHQSISILSQVVPLDQDNDIVMEDDNNNLNNNICMKLDHQDEMQDDEEDQIIPDQSTPMLIFDNDNIVNIKSPILKLKRSNNNSNSRLLKQQINHFNNNHNNNNLRNGKVKFDDLPIEVFVHIFGYLEVSDMCMLQTVSKHIKEASSVFVLWKQLYFKHWQSKSSNLWRKLYEDPTTSLITGKQLPPNSEFLKKKKDKDYKHLFQVQQTVDKHWKKGICTVQTLYGHTDGVWGVQFHGNTLVSGSEDGTMKIWDLEEGECQHTLTGHSDVINSFHYENDRVVSGSDDSTLKVWNIESGKCLTTFNGHVGSVWMLEFKKDCLVSGGDDKTVRLWDMNTGQHVRKLTGHTGRIYYVHMGVGPIVVSGSQDRTCRVWDIRSPSHNAIHTMVSNSPVHCLQMNGSLDQGGDWNLASGQSNGNISVWSMRTGSLQAMLSNPLCCPVWHIQYRQNTIYTSSCNNLHAWNLNISPSTSTPINNPYNSNTNDTTPNNNNNNNIQQTTNHLTCSRVFKGHTKSIKHFQVKNNRMVSGGMDNKIKVWDLDRPGGYLYTLPGHTASVDWLEFNKDKLLSCSADHTIRVWDFYSA